MEAEDLRIGNFVYVDKEAIWKVVETSKWDKQTCVSKPDSSGYSLEDNYGINRLSGIPLTEEILLKAGFEHYLDYSYELNFLDESNTAIHVDFDEDDLTKVARVCIGQEDPRIEKRDRAREWVYFKKNIDSVHQLQNLYFALTGEELNIEL